MLDRNVLERERDGHAALRRHEPEPPALLLQPRERVLHPRAALEPPMERLVVRAIDLDELLDAALVEEAHLLVQARAADRGHQDLVLDLAPEHGLRRVTHRREDDLA